MIEDDARLPEEEQALGALPRELAPPSHLEESTVRRLREAGVIRAANRRRWVPQLAAAVILFATGLVIGRVWTSDGGTIGDGRYLLLLYGADTTSPEAEASRVAEYSAWAREEGRAGRLLSGEKLGDDAIVLQSDRSPNPQIAAPSGFFMIRAQSLAEAEATAGRCPHLRHGGTVIVKPVISRSRS